jgi:hypothetical protein
LTQKKEKENKNENIYFVTILRKLDFIMGNFLLESISLCLDSVTVLSVQTEQMSLQLEV